MDLSDGYVPHHLWSKDHWSTLAYIESVSADVGGFEIGRDARMRSCRRNFRVMSQECPSPKRPGPQSHGVVMKREHSTRLNDDTSVEGHDDWHCIQDLAREGLFEQGPEQIEPGVMLQLNEKGFSVTSALRKHKAEGGNFAGFQMPPEVLT